MQWDLQAKRLKNGKSPLCEFEKNCEIKNITKRTFYRRRNNIFPIK